MKLKQLPLMVKKPFVTSSTLGGMAINDSHRNTTEYDIKKRAVSS